MPWVCPWMPVFRSSYCYSYGGRKCKKGNPPGLPPAMVLVRQAGWRRRVLLRRVSRSVAEAMERKRPAAKKLGATALPVGLHSKNSADLAARSFDESLGSPVNIEVHPVGKPRFLKQGWVVFLIGLGFGKAFKFPFNQVLESGLTPKRNFAEGEFQIVDREKFKGLFPSITPLC